MKQITHVLWKVIFHLEDKNEGNIYIASFLQMKAWKAGSSFPESQKT